uniref:Uncharacterized protein n=1 Tax=Amicula sp. isolate GU52X-4 cfCalB7 TaxID=3003489 RepID=A0A9E8YZH9_9STRA|nr:hypothetical protein [Amicula sp. isolate GU52X-4 cfCalB7]WAK84983.1 hypothetical protein [Amicula sp. isolate GU52X-4 cfCalB7]
MRRGVTHTNVVNLGDVTTLGAEFLDQPKMPSSGDNLPSLKIKTKRKSIKYLDFLEKNEYSDPKNIPVAETWDRFESTVFESAKTAQDVIDTSLKSLETDKTE